VTIAPGDLVAVTGRVREEQLPGIAGIATRSSRRCAASRARRCGSSASSAEQLLMRIDPYRSRIAPHHSASRQCIALQSDFALLSCERERAPCAVAHCKCSVASVNDRRYT
jgi:hypothetical protein